MWLKINSDTRILDVTLNLSRGGRRADLWVLNDDPELGFEPEPLPGARPKPRFDIRLDPEPEPEPQPQLEPDRLTTVRDIVRDALNNGPDGPIRVLTPPAPASEPPKYEGAIQGAGVQ